MSQVAILVPVLNRPHRIAPLLESIAAATDVPHRVIFGCSDQPTVDELDRVGAWYIRDEGGAEGTWPKRINRLAAATDERFLFTAADDLDFHAGWFQAALQVMNTLPECSGVVSVNDMYNPAGTHFLIERGYVDRFGVIDAPGTVMCESYVHSHCDDECRATAKFHGRYARAQDAVVEHLHYGAGKSPHDAVYAMGEASMPGGHTTYISRAHLWEKEPS